MDKGTPLVVAVIANWNLRKDLLECLESLYKTDYPNMHVIVVDNNSTDDSIVCVQKQFPQTQLIKRNENGGYAAALNDGIRAGSVLNPDFFLVLNNDTLVPSETLGKLVDTMLSDTQIAISAPKVIYHDHPERIFSLGDRIYSWFPLPVRIGRKAYDRPAYSKTMEFDYLFGCALLLRTQSLKQVGLFDTSFFMYYEDADLCRRMSDKGWKNVRVGSAVIRHKASLSSTLVPDEMIYLRARNRFWFYRRYHHGPHPALTYLALLLGSIRTVFIYLVTGKKSKISPYVKGTQDGIKRPVPPLTDTEWNW
jgi:GT2 family glycosyltransferase